MLEMAKPFHTMSFLLPVCQHFAHQRKKALTFSRKALTIFQKALSIFQKALSISE